MTQPTLRFVPCVDSGHGHRMAYWQWGDDKASHVVICLHGLTRQGRDFDRLAQALLVRAGNALRVVCPDVVGRGRSDWLGDAAGYQIPQYASDMRALIVQLHAERPVDALDLVGTSMGGLISIVLAGSKELALPVAVRRLVLNDIGPALNTSGLQRIADYVGAKVQFRSLHEAANAMWALSSSFGPHTEEQWLELSRHMVVPASQRTADGRAKLGQDETAGGPLVLHYDPAISLPFKAVTAESTAQAEVIMWALYDAIRARTLLTRGAQSDLLSPVTARSMTERGPKARLQEFDGVGHAPTFVDPAQSAVVADFLLN